MGQIRQLTCDKDGCNRDTPQTGGVSRRVRGLLCQASSNSYSYSGSFRNHGAATFVGTHIPDHVLFLMNSRGLIEFTERIDDDTCRLR